MDRDKKHLEIWALRKEFRTARGPLVVVEDFTLSLARGEFVSVIGHSGCGKSTVLSIIAGLNGSSGGSVVLNGREVTGPGTDRGVVFQAPCLFPWLTALQNVTLGLEQALPRETRSGRDEIAQHYLGLVGLGSSAHKRPSELSQGMKQRVGLARAFALKPEMLLLDEPFGMLDSLTRLELHEVLLELWEQNKKTLLMVTHDVDEALYLSDRVVMMTNGPNATVGEVFQVPFARPRKRAQLLEDPDYYVAREHLIGFLEEQAHDSGAPPQPPVADADADSEGEEVEDAPRADVQYPASALRDI